MTYTEMQRRLEDIVATAVVAGRYQNNNGARKRASGDEMEQEAKRKAARLLNDLYSAGSLAR